MQVTLDQLLAKIGYLTVLLDAANQRVAELEAETQKAPGSS